VHFIEKFVLFARYREFTGLLNTAELYTDLRLLGVLADVRVKLPYSGKERLIGRPQTFLACVCVLARTE
jgi:hypothetical protein